MEAHVALSSGLLYELSVEQIAMCAPNTQNCGGTGKCQGSTAELAFEYATNSVGLYEEFQYGYTSYNGTNFDCLAPSREESTTSTSPLRASDAVAAINGYVHLPNNNYTVLMNAVARVGPVAINVDATTWAAYNSGVFEGCNPKYLDINHVVVLVVSHYHLSDMHSRLSMLILMFVHVGLWIR
jgi:cathepsin L